MKPIRITPRLSMTFQPEAWNDSKVVSKTNCLAYALDRPDLGVPFLRNVHPVSRCEKDAGPSLSERLDASPLPCIRLIFAGMSRIREHEHSPDTHHIIAYAPMMLLGHFFRMDKDRTWSHKQGAREATNKDEKDRVITHPETADFNLRHFDASAFYNRAQKTIEEIRRDCLYPPHAKQELIHRQRELIIAHSPSDPAGKKIIYLALPKRGIAVTPRGLA